MGLKKKGDEEPKAITLQAVAKNKKKGSKRLSSCPSLLFSFLASFSFASQLKNLG
ncbi:MAG: hypothetical protein HON25_06550 [Gammaproteobacteria bacterium]|jgi:hypothetical protein|nr:hypothetical protein [Gammaproteobacteria bacterium]MDA8868763.1 hypothetical protein [Pseudomonadales bacterium]MBT3696808.1 hypothetical protein [Gammaproteobacteria bacterium]MBT5333987.1 hypothetical protein [Gammaproteobacteria bacterium]MBT5680448.1 hypothetical protein [Gammaproteobacteria bacterium]